MKKRLWGINKNIFLLGIVSFLTDVSSEMIFSVFSIFFTVILGASTALLGLVEGLADFASCSLDYFAGWISDKTGKRKKFAILGYGFSTIAKVFLIFANSVILASAFRVIERLGKSFRGPPRDAWISSLSTKSNRGFSFGVHKALDKAGAIIGPFIAYFILAKLGQNAASFKFLFQIAIIPAVAAVVFLAVVKDKPATPARRIKIIDSYKKTSREFKHYLKTSGIFSLAYFSFGFLLLKAYSAGFAVKDVVLLYALFNIAFVVVSAPVGKLGDCIGRRKLIATEYIIYLAMCLGFIFASTKAQIIALFVLFGIFYAIDEGQSKAYVADCEKKRRATAIGTYYFTVGIIYLPASIIAGILWKINPNCAFVFAGVISLAALVFFASQKRHKEQPKTIH